jgi:hypothetical protein
MFNAISRQACQDTISRKQQLQPLLSYSDLLYSDANTCWYQTPEYQYSHFPQPEGFTQGCPLSGAFADIVLTLVLRPINKALQQRIHTRDPTEIPLAATLSYHDDTSIVLPYQDIDWFLYTFQHLGNPLGIRLNLAKTQILTTLTTNDPQLTPNDRTHWNHTLNQLHPDVEQREGIRLLGQPIGSSHYATTFFQHYITRLQHIVSQQLTHRIQDHQTQIAILKHCTIPSTFHLLATHAYHQWQTTHNPTLHHWNSEETLAIRILIHNLLAHIAQQQTLPTYAIPLIHLPATLGGIEIRDPIAATIPATITTITRTLRYIKYGFSTSRGLNINAAPIHIHSINQTTFTNILQHHAPSFLPILQTHLKTTTKLSLEHFIQHSPLHCIQKVLYHEHQHTVRKNFAQYAPATIMPMLDSLLSPLTSIPIASMSRCTTTNHIPNPEFRPPPTKVTPTHFLAIFASTKM